MIYVPDYWPFFKTSELRRFDYTDPTGSMPPITSVFAYDKGTDSMLYVDYDAHLNWKDTWYYKATPDGLMEWRDDYPGKKVVMSPGIGWGGYVEIGGTYINKPHMSPFQSWPPALSSGVQIVAYEKLIGDTLVFTYLQSWSGKPGAGARYWMKRSVGPVAVQWLAQDPKDPYGRPIITTARMDAEVSSVSNLIS